MKRHLRGMTLTEMAIVLGAMGLISGAIWAIVGTVWDGYRFRKMNQQVQTVAQALQDYYGNIGCLCSNVTGSTKTAYANGDITAIIDADARRLIPIEMRSNKSVAGSTINHAMGGTFTVESMNSGSSFRLHIFALKKEACMRLLMEFPVTLPEMGVIRIASGGGNAPIDANDIVTTANTFPLSLTVANNWCNNTTNNEVSIDFKVRK